MKTNHIVVEGSEALGYLVAVHSADIEALEAEVEDLQERVDYYSHQLSDCNDKHARIIRALNSIYDALDGTDWSSDTCAEIAQILEHAGYAIHAPGEPEGLVHGDTGEGAEG